MPSLKRSKRATPHSRRKKDLSRKGLITLYTRDVWSVIYDLPHTCYRFCRGSDVLATVSDYQDLRSAFAWTSKSDRNDGLYCDESMDAGIAIRIKEGELWITSINIDSHADGYDMNAVWHIPLNEWDRLTTALRL